VAVSHRGGAGLEASTEFLAWLKRSPRHTGEFLFATATFKALAGADPVDFAEPAGFDNLKVRTRAMLWRGRCGFYYIT